MIMLSVPWDLGVVSWEYLFTVFSTVFLKRDSGVAASARQYLLNAGEATSKTGGNILHLATGNARVRLVKDC